MSELKLINGLSREGEVMAKVIWQLKQHLEDGATEAMAKLDWPTHLLTIKLEKKEGKDVIA